MHEESKRLFKQLGLELEARLHLLTDKPEETAENCLKALWAFAAGNPVSAVAASPLEPGELSKEQQAIVRSAVEKRLNGVPLAHITGRQEFMGLELLAAKSALIPRKETEILASLALESIDEISKDVASPWVIDVCTGSGNLALAVLAHCPGIRIWGADLSEEAVSLAIENAIHLGQQGKIEFLAGDLLAPFGNSDFYKKVDLIICNPPYILSSNVQSMAREIAEHEPEMAFNGGPFGIKILDRIIVESADYLKSGGWLCLELGAGQGPFVKKRILKSGLYSTIDLAHDGAGVVRALRAQLT